MSIPAATQAAQNPRSALIAGEDTTNSVFRNILVDPNGVVQTTAVSTAASKPSTATHSAVTMTGSSVELLAANTDRRKFSIFNDSGNTIHIKKGTAASSSDFWLKMIDQAYYESYLDDYTGALHAIGASGDVHVTEVE